MRCIVCGDFSIIWNPEHQQLWCVQCDAEAYGLELPKDSNNLPEEVPVEVLAK